MVSDVTSTLAHDSVGEMCRKFNVIHKGTHHIMNHILRIFIDIHSYQRLPMSVIKYKISL